MGQHLNICARPVPDNRYGFGGKHISLSKLKSYFEEYQQGWLVRSIILMLVLLSTFPIATAQTVDVEGIGTSLRQLRNPFLGVGGGVTVASNFYASNNIDPRREPLQFMINAQLNLSFGPVDVPFSFSFSDGSSRFNLPSYAFTGISPRYKWITVHAGDRSMQFSRYTLDQLNFRGGGVELSPGKFRFKAMYGRLTRAVAEDLNSRQSLDPAYRRRGYSMLVGYEGDDLQVSGILFGASDDENSIPDPTLTDVTPAENVVGSLKGRYSIKGIVVLDAEYARSALNTDKRTRTNGEAKNSLSQILGLFTAKETANFGNAFNGGATYNHSKFSIRFGYERIDRGFKTLGALFFNSDLARYTGSFSTRLFKNKMTLALRGGLEETNKQDLDKPTNSRFVGSVNATYLPSNTWLFSLGYSNFNNSTKIRAREDPSVFVDSLFLAQLTQSITFTTNWKVKQEFNPASLTFVYSSQFANSIQGDDVVEEARTNFHNVSLIYNQKQTNSNINWNVSLNGNYTNFSGLNTTTISPSAGMNTLFFRNKLRSSLRLTYNVVLLENSSNSSVLNLAWVNNFNFGSGHVVGLTLQYTNRNAPSSNTALRSFNELFGRLFYSYQFDTNIGKKNK